MTKTLKDYAKEGDIVCVKKMIEKGTKAPEGILQDLIFFYWRTKETPNLEILDLLIDECSVDINSCEVSPKSLEIFGCSQTPLHLAATLSVVITEFLLKKGANPNLKDSENLTPIWAASTEAMELLIKAGADVNVKNEEGNSLSHSYFDDYDSIIAGIDEHFDEDDEDDEDEICDMLVEAEEAVTKKLSILLQNSKLDFTATKDGQTILHRAIMIEDEGNRESIIKLLIDGGCPVDLIKTENNDTLITLLLSSKKATEEIIEYLMDKGIDPNQKTNKGDTALQIAIEQKADKEIIELLSKYEK